MANAFEELLAAIPDENDRKALSELGGKYKEVKDGILRQSDYSRSMNSLQEDRKRYESEKNRLEADIDQLQKWRDWRAANWDDDTNLTKSEIEKIKELEDAKSEIEMLKAAQEAGMTFEEVEKFIEKDLQKRSIVTKDMLEKEIKPQLFNKEAYDKEMNQRLNTLAGGMGALYEETLPLAFGHRDEFGEVLKPGELIKYANENGIKDISKAYDSWVAPRRAEVQTKKYQEDLKKAKDEGKAEGRKETAMGQNGRIPVDQGAPTMGHMERKFRMAKDQQPANPIPEDMGLGAGVGNMVAQQYRKDFAEGNVLKD